MGLVTKSGLLIREELECPSLLRRFGSGWISGVTGLILGIASIGMVLVMRFPGVFGTAEMSGLSGARMHFLEILILRGATVLPIILFGFAQDAVNAYIILVYLWATFAHANIGWKFGWLDRIFVTPRFHHWHHGIEREAIDVNFAIHYPWLDRIFGTHHLPEGRWPDGYGIKGNSVPQGYWKQWWYPFSRKKLS